MDDEILVQHTRAKLALEAAIALGDGGLEKVPEHILFMLENESWKDYTIAGELVHNSSFEEFVTKKRPYGLGQTMERIRHLCRLDERAMTVLDAIDSSTQRYRGAQHNNKNAAQNKTNVDNVNIRSRPDGNSVAVALRRLRKDRPDLHKRVLNGELSTHAAMVEAGFRKRHVSIPTEDPEAIARTLKRHMQAEEIETLIHLLMEEAVADSA